MSLSISRPNIHQPRRERGFYYLASLVTNITNDRDTPHQLIHALRRSLSELAELIRLCSPLTHVNDEPSFLNSSRLPIIFDFSTIGEQNI